MTFRAQIEAVLYKHRIPFSPGSDLLTDLLARLPQPSPQACRCGNLPPNETLWPSWCPACWHDKKSPQPSREALPTILGGHVNQIGLPEILWDKLMAWASGSRERTWCKHIQWDTNRLWWYITVDAPGKGEYQPIGQFWGCCPVSGCHAPKPQDA